MFTSSNRATAHSARAVRASRDGVDAAFELYLEWRRQSSACESAYRSWTSSAYSRDAALTFATYTAALDREQQAAAQYEHALRRG